MTPAARVQAAIEVLDIVLAGMPAEQALTRWARGSRFAGSKDRRAVRDHVFDVLRRRRVCAALGGGEGGRDLMLGLVRSAGLDAEALFDGARHSPDPLAEAERAGGRAPGPEDDMHLPDWLIDVWRTDVDTPDIEAACLGARAPVFLRVNIARATPEQARSALEQESIEACPSPLSPWALEVTSGAPRLRQSAAYAEGIVELQDAASQAVVAALPSVEGPILDYCAGGGGKTLALAARYGRRIDAWDRAVARMGDLPDRAARAGAEVRVHDRLPAGRYALVLADAPCSGAGAWRRTPDAKWRLTPADLDRLRAAQDNVLDGAMARCAEDGILAYATCSVLRRENEDRIDAFVARHPGWRVRHMQRWALSDGADGFFTAQLTRD